VEVLGVVVGVAVEEGAEVDLVEEEEEALVGEEVAVVGVAVDSRAPAEVEEEDGGEGAEGE
jgi:hypothetical protein